MGIPVVKRCAASEGASCAACALQPAAQEAAQTAAPQLRSQLCSDLFSLHSKYVLGFLNTTFSRLSLPLDNLPRDGTALAPREGENSISLFSNTLTDQQWVSSFLILTGREHFPRSFRQT